MILTPIPRDRLEEARHDVGAGATLDETHLLPAWQRYAGPLYKAANERLASAVVAGVPMLIVSGGYGLVLAEESIGWYNLEFSLGDWPPQLLQEIQRAPGVHVEVVPGIGETGRNRHLSGKMIDFACPGNSRSRMTLLCSMTSQTKSQIRLPIGFR